MRINPDATATPTILTTPPAPSPIAQPTNLAESEEGELRKKIGQMLLVGFRGLHSAAVPALLADIAQRHLGGIVLFSYDVPTQNPLRNVESPAQVKQLIADLQAQATIPLIVSLDQEGGMVKRFGPANGFPDTRSHRSLGQQNDLLIAHQAASEMAQVLASTGINLNLAPVVDLDSNPLNPAIGYYERSFSPDPQVVIAHASEFIRAHHEQGVLCTLKHFPGHGSSSSDSHRGMVDVTRTWHESELEPYRSLINLGLADAVMTAHVFSPLDPEWPATLSHKTLTGILRQQLGYAGVIFTDDMQMGAITEFYGLETAIEQTIRAGADVISFSNNSTQYDERIVEHVVAIILKLVNEEKISPSRIDQSYQRIQKFKQRFSA